MGCAKIYIAKLPFRRKCLAIPQSPSRWFIGYTRIYQIPINTKMYTAEKTSRNILCGMYDAEYKLRNMPLVATEYTLRIKHRRKYITGTPLSYTRKYNILIQTRTYVAGCIARKIRSGKCVAEYKLRNFSWVVPEETLRRFLGSSGRATGPENGPDTAS